MTPTRRGWSGSGERMWTGEGGYSPMWTSTDTILSSYAKKLAYFSPAFRLWTKQKVEIFQRYKVI